MVVIADWVWVIGISCVACVSSLVSCGWDGTLTGWGFLFGFHG
jgi:hypothetical protein